jgi:hypothetical protein
MFNNLKNEKMKKLFILFSGMLMVIMSSCVIQKHIQPESYILNEYTDSQVDSFYKFNSDIKFRSYFLTKKYLSEVDNRDILMLSINRKISVLTDSITALSAYVHKGSPVSGGNSKVLYYHLGNEGYEADKSIEFDFRNEKVPQILQFFVMFNITEKWESVGTFSVDLGNLQDSWYGVTCPEGEGSPTADFKASYTVQYDKYAKKVTVKRAQIGRRGKNNGWYDSFDDTHYGIKSIVAIY